MVVVLFSCKIQDEGTSDPTNPDIISLTVTSPQGGDILYAVSVFDIKWSSNTTQKLIIEYTVDNGQNWLIVSSEVDNTGSHIWAPVPNTLTSTARIRITTLDGALSSLSEGFFSIVQGSAKTIIVDKPNGGEVWRGNSSQDINWVSSGVDSVTIEYTVDNGLNWMLIATDQPSTGFYNWNPIPNIPSTNAKVRIKDTEDGLAIDESNGVFTIEPADMITLTSPRGGEEWLGGSSQYIQWNTLLAIGSGSIVESNPEDELISDAKLNGKLGKGDLSAIETNSSVNSINSIEAIDNIKIEYSVNGASSWNTIVESTPNNGIYFWSSIPVENSANCVIRVSDAIDGVPFDYNEVVFSIFATLPKEITIITPNGGEAWAAGTAQDIKWSSKDVSFVKIEYTTNNGVDWITIVENTESDGFYTWEQLPTGAASNCRLKISDVGAIASDLSDELFSITPEPSIDLTSPNGGETLQSGSSINITWTSENIAKIKIEYTINGGAEWLLIADSIESTGYYTWENIPDVNSNQVKIKISDADDGAPSDMSTSNLAISNQIVQILEVTEPNGGENWEANTAKNITWSSSAVTHVKIEFTENNGLDWVEIESNLPSSGSYDWSVPNVNSTQAKIRISDAVDGDPIDESNGTFRIKQAGTLRLLNPQPNVIWVAGALNRIEWEAENIEKVKIEFTTTNAVYDPNARWEDDEWFDLVTNYPGAAGFYDTRFTIPSIRYKLRISDAEFDEPIDFSGLFTVIGQPSYTLQMTSPNGGENWIIGEPYEITWISENVERVSIDYSLNNGTTWDNVVTDIASNGIYNWVVPDIPLGSDLCKIRIQHSSDMTIFDLSDTPFSIHSKTNLLRVVAPNGGEVVQAGQPTRIEYTQTGVKNVDIYFTIDNTTTWHKIITRTNSTGAYMWTPPDTSSALARIKIVDSDDASVQDESDSYFNILKEDEGQVEVLFPNGGEQLVSGESSNITWQTKNVKNIKIEYSNNSGSDWIVLIASTPTDPGTYNWNPVPTSETKHGIIRISDADRLDINDISDAPFSIYDAVTSAPTIAIVSPSIGDDWYVGSSRNIQWTSNNVGNVTLEYSSDGSTWINIATNISNTGRYLWLIPNDESNRVKVRVSEAVDSDPAATSSEFSIRTQNITLTSPNGSESWVAGEFRNISWTSINIEEIQIQYTLDQGNSWTTIASVSGATNQYNWLVPNESSNNSLVRVQDASDLDPFDESDAVFEIKPLPIILLTSPNGGEILIEGSKHPITWTSQYVENVRIEFSENNGGSWVELVASTPSDGEWIWDPINNAISGNCAIRISDASRNDISSQSAIPFTIEKKVDQVSGEPASIFLVSQSLDAIGITEVGDPETAKLLFEVQDSSGTPINIANKVDVSFRFGAQPGGGELLAPSLVETNENGQVTVNLTSGSVAGAVQVFAEINFNGNLIISRPVSIVIARGLPHLAHFSLGSSFLNYPYLNINGAKGKVTALVGDRYSNPVRIGTSVYFNTDAGNVTPDNKTDFDGLTSVEFTSGNPQPNDPVDGPGFFYVHANTIDENDANITTKTRVLYSGAPIITANPGTFNIADGGSQAFTYTVMDINGNPLAPDNNYTVSVSGDADIAGDINIEMPDVQVGNTSFNFAVSDPEAGDFDPPAAVTIIISVTGPNGIASMTISGTVD